MCSALCSSICIQRGSRAKLGRGRNAMNSIEAEGWTIEEAVSAALRQLQAEREQVEIKLLYQATKGFLGIGGKKARVRATLRVPLAALIMDIKPTPVRQWLMAISFEPPF